MRCSQVSTYGAGKCSTSVTQFNLGFEVATIFGKRISIPDHHRCEVARCDSRGQPLASHQLLTPLFVLALSA